MFKYSDNVIVNGAILGGLFGLGGTMVFMVNALMKKDYRRESRKAADDFAKYCAIYASQKKNGYSGDLETFRKQLKEELEAYLETVKTEENEKEFRSIIKEVLKLN